MIGGSYRKPLRKLRQGDIALCEFHQLRARSGEARGPGPEEVVDEEVPFLGAYQDFQIPVEIPGMDRPMQRVLRAWFGYVVVVSQSCELEYAGEADSRVQVAPLVSPGTWPQGPWDLIRNESLPGYLYLPSARQDELGGADVGGDWPESAVALASTTLASRGIVGPNRVLALSPGEVTRLQQAIVRFFTVRGWADVSAAEQLVGKTVIGVHETTETVPGPARLTKVVLDAPDGGDEITVVCGLRKGRKT